MKANLNEIIERVGGEITEVFEALPANSTAPQAAFAEVFPDVISGLVEKNPNITENPFA